MRAEIMSNTPGAEIRPGSFNRAASFDPAGFDLVVILRTPRMRRRYRGTMFRTRFRTHTPPCCGAARKALAIFQKSLEANKKQRCGGCRAIKTVAADFIFLRLQLRLTSYVWSESKPT